MTNYNKKLFQYNTMLISKTSLILRPTEKWNKGFLMQIFNNHLINYGTPINVTYSWSFGSLAGICLITQVISGLFLAMFYTAHIDLAFYSLEFIMRDVNNGWLVRYIHLNGASMFFLAVYYHVLRGLFYNSYSEPREFLWLSGVILLLLMMATAFLGYVLPWGQMSFWGATVITSMFTVIPKVGQSIVEWLWGGYTVNNPTLNRFFTFHFILPSILVGLMFLHLALLHNEGSSAPMSDSTAVDQISFYPYFFVKDLFPFFCFLLLLIAFVMYGPNQLGDPNNYIQADSIRTPRHIVPEWYFLPFYAMLRSIPHKVAGILAMFFSLFILFAIPFLNFSLVKDSSSRLFFKVCYFVFLAALVSLIWLGQSPVEDIYIFAGQFVTVYYFIFFLIILPFSGLIANFLKYMFFSNGFWGNFQKQFKQYYWPYIKLFLLGLFIQLYHALAYLFGYGVLFLVLYFIYKTFF